MTLYPIPYTLYRCQVFSYTQHSLWFKNFTGKILEICRKFRIFENYTILNLFIGIVLVNYQ